MPISTMAWMAWMDSAACYNINDGFKTQVPKFVNLEELKDDMLSITMPLLLRYT